MKRRNSFLKDESGAITLDWVALTAGAVVVGIVVVYGVFNGGPGSVNGLVQNYKAELGVAADNILDNGLGDLPGPLRNRGGS